MSKSPVSEVSIVSIKPKFGHIAFASFVLFEAFYISSVAVHSRPYGGIRLVYPRKKNLDVCYPINNSIGKIVEDAVYDEMIKYELI